MPAAFWGQCMELYLVTPALVNVALNYKICVEQGLPLHPTHYFEVNDLNRFTETYHPAMATGPMPVPACHPGGPGGVRPGPGSAGGSWPFSARSCP